MLICQTDKWRTQPPIQTDPVLGLIRRPASLLADLPDPIAHWAIAAGYAVPYGDSPPKASPAEASPEQLDLILDFLNKSDQSEIAAVKGISESLASKIVKSRPLTADGLGGLLTSRHLQSLRLFVEGVNDGES